MRLAVGLPSLDSDSPQRRALDDTFAALVERGHDVEGFTEHDRTEDAAAFPVFHYMRLAERHDALAFDAAVYPLGRDASPYQGIFTALRRHPGVVWLLDPIVHHLAVGGVALLEDWAGYREMLDEAYGDRGAPLAQTVANNWGTGALFRRYNLVASLVQDQQRVLASWDSLASRVAGDLGFVPETVPLPMTAPAATVAPTEARTVAIMSVNESFATGAVRAAAALLDSDTEFVVRLCLSEPVYKAEGLPVATKLGVEDRIDWQLTTSPRELQDLASASDVLVWLAEELQGVHRMLLVQGLAEGKPTIVPDADLYDDLPRGVVARVDLGRGSGAACRSIVEALASDAALREGLQQHARGYAAETPDAARAAEALEQALRTATVLPETAVSAGAWSRVEENLLAATLPAGTDAATEERIRTAIRRRADEFDQ